MKNLPYLRAFTLIEAAVATVLGSVMLSSALVILQPIQQAADTVAIEDASEKMRTAKVGYQAITRDLGINKLALNSALDDVAKIKNQLGFPSSEMAQIDFINLFLKPNSINGSVNSVDFLNFCDSQLKITNEYASAYINGCIEYLSKLSDMQSEMRIMSATKDFSSIRLKLAQAALTKAELQENEVKIRSVLQFITIGILSVDLIGLIAEAIAEDKPLPPYFGPAFAVGAVTLSAYIAGLGALTGLYFAPAYTYYYEKLDKLRNSRDNEVEKNNLLRAQFAKLNERFNEIKEIGPIRY